MERNEYVLMCQKASFKTACSGAWWNVKWNPDELVKYQGHVFVPVDYKFGFQKGKPLHLAILHALESNTEYTALLKDVEKNDP